MKKNIRIVLLFAIAIMSICLCACGKTKKKSGTSTEIKKGESEIVFSINADNSFSVEYKEGFDKDYYSESELKEFADTEIADFNSNYAVNSSNGITVENVSVDKKVASVKLRFVDSNDYIAYCKNYVDDTRNARFFNGTYDEAVAAGYNFATDFKKVSDNSAMDISEIESLENVYVAYTNEGLKINVSGEVIAVGKNVEYVDGVVKTSDKRDNYFIYKLN